ncbi:hypothetical protein FSP39_020031 [Pinctada imbricata]|uniref:Mitochondria-eating protein C-terminal domain-containing protein n=1 Tax=Pinctada imbricata TaxID=66713 RepID=A0AA88Y9M0_PINIB|nr:hypothetical protein FSP39_020031 [Pinctada imbricata]
MANFNEQYSRKNNVKILNWKEPEKTPRRTDNANEKAKGENLLQELIKILKEKVKVSVEPQEILAIHRIPGKKRPPPPKDETEAKEPSSELAKVDKEENADQAKDQSTMQEGGGDVKGKKQAKEGVKGQVNQRLKHYVEKQAKEMIKGLSSFSSKNAADVFVSEQLPSIIQGEKCNEKRVIAYSKMCVELCWYMSVQDPPMILVALADGDKMNTEQYSYFGRQGKVVEVCVWPALFLHTGGPLVAKGFVLPK